MDRDYKEHLLRRYESAMRRIGGAHVLLALPDILTKPLKETTDLRIKVTLLEEIAKKGGMAK